MCSRKDFRKAVALLLFIGGTFLGCRQNAAVPYLQRQILQKNNELSREYLEADVGHAKECLAKSARLLEEGTVLEPSGRAGLLSLNYYRLFCLEHRTGNQTGAKVALIKARYWRLLQGELSNSVQEAVKNVDELTGERILIEIDQFDKSHHSGAPAKYVQILAASGRKFEPPNQRKTENEERF